MAAIEVRSLTKRFGSVLAVDGISFDVQPGRVTGFLGPNGAGKTTTLRMVLGLARPTSGSVAIEGSSYRGLADPAGTVGAALEHAGFHPGRRGRDHLRVIARAAGIPESRADETLELVALADAGRRRVGGYSLGMRQRLALATALLGDPKILVLDEPANGLDPQGIRWLRDFLRWYAGEGRTVLVSSHVLAEVAQTADAAIVIAKGRVVAEGSIQELTAGRAGVVEVISPRAEQLAGALRGRGFEVSLGAEGALRVTGVEQAVIGDLALAEGIAIHGLRTEQASLEEVFFELTGGGGAPA
ncbi:MAG TPA: ATP-binding cassette domain-containing protein [Thermoleophilaceae bacterium]